MGPDQQHRGRAADPGFRDAPARLRHPARRGGEPLLQQRQGGQPVPGPVARHDDRVGQGGHPLDSRGQRRLPIPQPALPPERRDRVPGPAQHEPRALIVGGERPPQPLRRGHEPDRQARRQPGQRGPPLPTGQGTDRPQPLRHRQEDERRQREQVAALDQLRSVGGDVERGNEHGQAEIPPPPPPRERGRAQQPGHPSQGGDGMEQGEGVVVQRPLRPVPQQRGPAHHGKRVQERQAAQPIRHDRNRQDERAGDAGPDRPRAPSLHLGQQQDGKRWGDQRRVEPHQHGQPEQQPRRRGPREGRTGPEQQQGQAGQRGRGHVVVRKIGGLEDRREQHAAQQGAGKADPVHPPEQRQQRRHQHHERTDADDAEGGQAGQVAEALHPQHGKARSEPGQEEEPSAEGIQHVAEPQVAHRERMGVDDHLGLKALRVGDV